MRQDWSEVASDDLRLIMFPKETSKRSSYILLIYAEKIGGGLLYNLKRKKVFELSCALYLKDLGEFSKISALLKWVSILLICVKHLSHSFEKWWPLSFLKNTAVLWFPWQAWKCE